MPSLADALAAGPVVLDGGLSTELEARGHDVSSALWSARLLRDDPAAIVAAHAAFAAAGAQVATTASYQATVEGFVAAGVDAAEARRLIRSSVALAREGQGDGWVAGSVGPYGAMLADGSEYTGAYVAGMDIRALRAFHRPRMEILAEAGADVLACETVPAAAEAEALVAEAASLGVPIWLSLTTVLDASGVPRTRRGEPAADVYALVAGVDEVVAVGVNCIAPSAVGPSLAAAAAARQAAGRLSEQRRGLGRADTAAGPAHQGAPPRTCRAGWPPAPAWSAAAAACAPATSRPSPRWSGDLMSTHERLRVVLRSRPAPSARGVP